MLTACGLPQPRDGVMPSTGLRTTRPVAPPLVLGRMTLRVLDIVYASQLNYSGNALAVTTVHAMVFLVSNDTLTPRPPVVTEYWRRVTHTSIRVARGPSQRRSPDRCAGSHPPRITAHLMHCMPTRRAWLSSSELLAGGKSYARLKPRCRLSACAWPAAKCRFVSSQVCLRPPLSHQLMAVSGTCGEVICMLIRAALAYSSQPSSASKPH